LGKAVLSSVIGVIIIAIIFFVIFNFGSSLAKLSASTHTNITFVVGLEFLIFFIIALFPLIVRILQYKYIFYALTNSRILIQVGFIGRDFKSINYDKIQEATVVVGFVDKFFGTGTVSVTTAGMQLVATRRGAYTLIPRLQYVKNPYEIMKEIKKLAKTHNNA